MPTKANGWSITWSARTERPNEIGDEDQLRAADHLGCFGAAVEHALAQANIAATRLAITAQTAPSADNTPQPVVVEVRAQIPGIPLDQTILETVLRRVEAPCATWKALAAEAGVQVTGILEDPAAAEAAAPQTDAVPPAHQPKPSAAPASPTGRRRVAGLTMPAWLTLRMGTLLALAFGGLALLAYH